jgi:tripartite-type tricarboxylate transporter receptor subunit TctC
MRILKKSGRERISMVWKISVLAILMCSGSFTREALGSPQNYPTKPIELIIPWSAGGATDIIGRLFAKYASQEFGQTVVVTNKTGAGGILATSEIVKAPADGYKLLLQSISFHVIQAKTEKLPFNPSLVIPIANFTEGIQGCVVKGDSPWKSFGDMIDFGRKNPGKLTWSHAGVGIPPHMAMEVALDKAGIKAVSVPYKGTPEAMAAFLGGHVKAGSMAYSALKDQVAAGKARYLTIWRDKRFEEIPEVPCSAELGFQESAKIRSFFGIYAHRDVPKEIVNSIENVSKKVCLMPEFKNDLNRMGQPLVYLSSSELSEFISQAGAQVTPILKRLGLYVGEK